MNRRITEDFIPVLRDVYFKGQYAPQSHYLAELNLLHSIKLEGLGGEQMLNDANTKKLVGESDFTGTQVPSDANGIINAITVEYGVDSSQSPTSNPAIVAFTSLKASFPAWLLNSELVLKSKSVEQFRIRVSELVTNEKPAVVATEWAKQLERALKVTSNQDLQLFLSTPAGAALTSGSTQFVRVNLYGVKFAPRTI